MLIVTVDIATNGPTKRGGLLTIKNDRKHSRYPDYGNYEVRVDGNPIHFIRNYERSRGIWPLVALAARAVPDGW